MDRSKVFGFIDIGTNSVRLLVIRISLDRSWEVLIRHKNSVRLGEGEFEQHSLIHTAIERTTAIIKRYAEIAREYQACDIIAVATSATREAENRTVFINHVFEQTGIEILVISGEEEARLIWLGVSRGLYPGLEKALFIDIGGGSTEVIIGDQTRPDLLTSLPLGAIRLSTLFCMDKESTPVSPRTLSHLMEHIELVISGITPDLTANPFTRVFGSSGTIIALESVASEHPELSCTHRPEILTLKEVNFILTYLCSLSISERKKVPGLNPNRADIIIAGAAVLQKLLERSGNDKIRISHRGLLFGLVEDVLANMEINPVVDISLNRYQAVAQLGKRFHLDEKHARHVMNLSIMLFDSSREAGLHDLPDPAREILIHAAYLHDIGSIISFARHHHHSCYIISSSSLPGFSQDELRTIGLITRYHRKSPPRNKDEILMHLLRGERKTILILTQILRMAESLDRTHDMRVESARFSRITGKRDILEICSARDCTVELTACQDTAAAFEKVFHKQLFISFAGNSLHPESIQAGLARDNRNTITVQ